MNGTVRVRVSLLEAVRGLWLGLAALLVGLPLMVLAVVSISLLTTGIGLLTTPFLLWPIRSYANKRRELNAEWGGIRVPEPYLPLPPTGQGVLGDVKRTWHMLRDPATWRDLLWLLVDCVAGVILAFLPLILLLQGIFGVLLLWLWDPITSSGAGSTYWYLFVPVSSFGTAQIAACVGVAEFLFSLFYAPRLITPLYFLLSRQLLKPTAAASLSRRVSELYETRHDAVDSSAAELRRIERDLHDGAQARLVAMGMSLGTIEALVEKDPAMARKMLAQARENSAEALTELRDLVRGIHPPVLAERGLGDAVKALSLRMQIPVEADIDLPGRFEEPVEAAAYFAVSEVLTNAVKHAEADRVWLDVNYAEGALRVTITDDGKGGANPNAGTGMLGVERRLGPFDGVMAVSSPVGGPTMVTMEVPCMPRPAGQSAQQEAQR